MTVYACGNSHVLALAAAATAWPNIAPDVEVFLMGSGVHEPTPFSTSDGPVVRLTVDRYAFNLQRFTGSPVIDDRATWGFVNINHNARIYRHECWTTYEPATVARDTAVPVSDGVVEAVVETDQLGVRTFFEDLRCAAVPFFAISAPPPRQDHPAISRGIRPEVVAYLDGCARRTWREWLGARGIPLVEPPPDTITDDGFLRTEFNAPNLASGKPDPHHANRKYGALMLARVAEVAGRVQPARPGTEAPSSDLRYGARK